MLYLPQDEHELVEYDPLEEEPTLYLAFARLGEAVWQSREGQLISRYPFPGERIPDDLIRGAIEFVKKYGSPMFLPLESGPPSDAGFIDFEDFSDMSLDTLLHQAQLVSLAVRYHRINTGEEAPTGFLEFIKAAIGELEDWSGAEARELVGDRNVDTHEEAMRVAEDYIKVTQERPEALGGLRLDAGFDLSADDHTSWKTVLTYQRLSNVIWYQLHRAMVLGATLRTCRNDTCPRSGSPFEPDRVDQKYCGKHCRDAHSAREWRIREAAKKMKQAVGQDLDEEESKGAK